MLDWKRQDVVSVKTNAVLMYLNLRIWNVSDWRGKDLSFGRESWWDSRAMREVEICLINIRLFVSVVPSFTIVLLTERSRLPSPSSSSFPSSSCSSSSSSSYPLLLANRSTFSSVLVVLPAATRFLLFSRGEMERRNGAVQAKSSTIRASSRRIFFARRKYLYNIQI